MSLLFDGKFASLTTLSLSFVHSTIGATADEANNLVAIVDTLPRGPICV
jgi:hypothetical protein